MSDWIKIAAVYGALEGALWSAGAARTVCGWLAAALIVLIVLAERRGPRPLGIGRAGPPAGWWIALAGAAAAGAIVLVGRRAGTLHDFGGAGWWVTHAAGYVVWALVQECIAQSFFFLHLEHALGARAAPAATALLFGAAHLPNPVLVPVTLAGGWILAAAFRRYRTVFPLAVAHALVGLSLLVAVPNRIDHHMRVGSGYTHYHSRHVPHPAQ